MPMFKLDRSHRSLAAKMLLQSIPRSTHLKHIPVLHGNCDELCDAACSANKIFAAPQA